MRRLTLLVSAVALSVATLSACVPGPPPPPPTDPRDVLVVGDSVAFSFGCALGDALPGVPAGGCPARDGYTAKNFAVGACTIYGVTVLLYNGGTAGVPNCDTVPAQPEGRTWAEAADFYVPKVVVINTGGWEIVDRFLSFTPVPDSQWGGSTSGQAYQNAAVNYSSALYHAIQGFRARGARVLVANTPYINPLQPVPPPGGDTPPGLECSWWEPHPNSPPTAQGDPPLDPLTCPGAWRAPRDGISYRSSRAKIDQLNAITNQVLTEPNPQFGFGSDPNVKSFNFRKHFNGPQNDYTDYVCPPPNDATRQAQNLLDLHTPDLLDTAWQCPVTPGIPLPDTPYAIAARAPDNGHLSVAGTFDILQPYLEACVKSMIPVTGGDPSACT